MRLLLVILLQLQAPLASADVVVLLNGDRMSGRVTGSTVTRVRLQTPYGVLSIPRERIERIDREGGASEQVSTPPTPAPPPPAPPEAARLHVAVRGDSFWQAWDPRTAPQDTSLRLELRLGLRPLVSYTDPALDPEDLPKATVNSFVFAPDTLVVRVSEGVVAAAPILAGNEIGLAIRIPGELSGSHELIVAYQVNEGSVVEPHWRDVLVTAAPIVLAPGATSRLQLAQSRGTMEFSRHGMRNLETFRISAQPDEDVALQP